MAGTRSKMTFQFMMLLSKAVTIASFIKGSTNHKQCNTIATVGNDPKLNILT
jgi:hypothetical protein